MRASPLAVLVLLALLPVAGAHADRQMDPELRGVIADALRPSQCFEDKYERAVWLAYMGPQLGRYVKDPQERTAYVAFGALREGRLSPTAQVAVSERAWRAIGSRTFVQPGKPVVVDELLHGMVVQCGNDATIALAEAIAGTEPAFAELMNREAARLGMVNSHFVNATGLPGAQHASTARDISLLAAALIRDFPQEYARYYAVREYRYNNITQLNRNRLLWLDASVDGVKTGFAEPAGYCLVASAQRGGRRLLSVVLGAASEFSVDGLDRLPRVDIIYAHANMSVDLIEAAVSKGAKGLVIAGVGDGNMTSGALEALRKAAANGVVVVRSVNLIAFQPRNTILLLAPEARKIRRRILSAHYDDMHAVRDYLTASCYHFMQQGIIPYLLIVVKYDGKRTYCAEEKFFEIPS